MDGEAGGADAGDVPTWEALLLSLLRCLAQVLRSGEAVDRIRGEDEWLQVEAALRARATAVPAAPNADAGPRADEASPSTGMEAQLADASRACIAHLDLLD